MLCLGSFSWLKEALRQVTLATLLKCMGCQSSGIASPTFSSCSHWAPPSFGLIWPHFLPNKPLQFYWETADHAIHSLVLAVALHPCPQMDAERTSLVLWDSVKGGEARTISRMQCVCRCVCVCLSLWITRSAGFFHHLQVSWRVGLVPTSLVASAVSLS